MTEEVQLVNEDGVLVGRDPETGEKVPVEIDEAVVNNLESESHGTESITFDQAQQNPGFPQMPQQGISSKIKPYDYANNPVATDADVDDITMTDPAGVADPFVVYEDGIYYMFAEVLADSANNDFYIGLWESTDGIDYTYQQIVVGSGSDQFSYPIVLKVDGTWYMLPSDGNNTDVQLYRATDFPTGWTHDQTLISTPYTAGDPTPVLWNGTWYMFVADNDARDKYLYYSDSFTGSYTEHPSSPVTTENGLSRNAGRPIVTDDYIDFWNRDPTVSGKPEFIRAMRITELTTINFAWTEWVDDVTQSPMARDHNEEEAFWGGSHHISPIVSNVQGQTPLFIMDGRWGPDRDWAVFAGGYEYESPSFSVTKSGDQSIGVSYEQVTWNRVREDTHQAWDSTSNKYTIPKDGKYRIEVVLGIEGDSSEVPYSFWALVSIDGDSNLMEPKVDVSNSTTDSNRDVTLSASHLIRLHEGETIGVEVRVLDAGTEKSLRGNPRDTWWNISYEGF